MALFLYRDFLPVLEGKDHLVVVDRDPAEQSADVAFVEGDQRTGQAFEECGKFPDFICPLGLQSTLRKEVLLVGSLTD